MTSFSFIFLVTYEPSCVNQGTTNCSFFRRDNKLFRQDHLAYHTEGLHPQLLMVVIMHRCLLQHGLQVANKKLPDFSCFNLSFVATLKLACYIFDSTYIRTKYVLVRPLEPNMFQLSDVPEALLIHIHVLLSISKLLLHGLNAWFSLGFCVRGAKGHTLSHIRYVADHLNDATYNQRTFYRNQTSIIRGWMMVWKAFLFLAMATHQTHPP